MTGAALRCARHWSWAAPRSRVRRGAISGESDEAARSRHQRACYDIRGGCRGARHRRLDSGLVDRHVEETGRRPGDEELRRPRSLVLDPVRDAPVPVEAVTFAQLEAAVALDRDDRPLQHPVAFLALVRVSAPARRVAGRDLEQQELQVPVGCCT